MTTQFIPVLARAVVRIDDRVLIARCKGAANTFLPGGHVRHGECMHAAITRELHEELGQACSVLTYIGAIEHSFSESGAIQHEINHVFEVELRNATSRSLLRSREDHLEFFWHPSSQLAAINLQPEPLMAFLQSNRLQPLWVSTLRSVSA